MTAIAVYGFGLIGGSVALAARASGGASRIVAIDRREVVESSRAVQIADERIDVGDEKAVGEGLASVDVVVLASPVSVILDVLPLVLGVARTVTDCGSTKRAIVEVAAKSDRRGRFVPGHPMAGRMGGGLERAREDIFRDRTWILCPERAADDAVAAVERLVEAVGARPARMSPSEHDAHVAVTSHLPQVLASALLVFAERQGARGASGPAFERMTRGARGSTAMWRDIFQTNGDELANAVRLFREQLADASSGLESEPIDVARVLALLAEAREVR